ncbi:MAG TPA: hypothetical protein VN924_17040 [Bryobacteraceae bacterium]|jgi:hypothetical protein|nr:hypothetical protein [Bryobacteraceae bacterium]
MARVQVINETTDNTTDPKPVEWTLWFQWCRYFYDDSTMEYGYRFIWKRPQSEGGSLQAARGQARIPSIALLERLVGQARAAGWGEYNADDFTVRQRMDALQVEQIRLGNAQRDRVLSGLPRMPDWDAQIAENSEEIAALSKRLSY